MQGRELGETKQPFSHAPSWAVVSCSLLLSYFHCCAGEAGDAHFASVTTPVEPFFGAVAHCGSAVTPGAAERSCEKTVLVFEFPPMFVPSLSWQNDHFYVQMVPKDAFFSPGRSRSASSAPPLSRCPCCPCCRTGRRRGEQNAGRPGWKRLQKPVLL